MAQEWCKKKEKTAGKRGFACDFWVLISPPLCHQLLKECRELCGVFNFKKRDCSPQDSFVELRMIPLRFQEQAIKHQLWLLEECGFSSNSLLERCSGNTWGKGIKESRGSIWSSRGSLKKSDIIELVSGRISGLTLLVRHSNSSTVRDGLHQIFAVETLDDKLPVFPLVVLCFIWNSWDF